MDSNDYTRLITKLTDQLYSGEIDEATFARRKKDLDINYVKFRYTNGEMDESAYNKNRMEILLEYEQSRAERGEITHTEYEKLTADIVEKHKISGSIFQEFNKGDTIMGRYRIIEKLGSGGMATVYLAENISLGKKVAIKKILPSLITDQGFIERFTREAQSQARLSHPNIAQVLDFDPESHSLIIEYIEGDTLDKKLSEGNISKKESLHIIKQVLSALNYAHQKGIIHRDIKPSNIMIDSNNNAKITDFGIALIMGQERHTKTGVGIGTPEYMSPEQIKGDKIIDHRTDVYSCGIVLYEMLTGQLPFKADGSTQNSDFAVKNMHISKSPDPLNIINPDIDKALSDIVLKSLSKSPDDRYSGCGEFHRVIEKYEHKKPAGPVKKTKLAESAKPARSSRHLAGILIIVVPIILAVLLFTFFRDNINRSLQQSGDGQQSTETDTSVPDKPDPEKDIREASDKLITEINSAISRDELDKAESRLSELKKLDPDNRNISVFSDMISKRKRELKDISDQKRQAELAQREADKRIRISDNLQKAETAFSSRRYTEAKQYANKVLELDSSHSRARQIIEQSDKAIEDANRAVASRLPLNPKAGARHEITVKGVSFALRYIPSGSFTMGSPSGEQDRDSDEIQHRVTLTKGFWMMETEVTQELYEAVTGNNPSYFTNNRQNPVENVSWHEAVDFCNSLSHLTGDTYRLPTEAEWEYACRAGSTTRFYWGNDMNYTEMCLYSNGADRKYKQKWPGIDRSTSNCDDGYPETSPVKSFRPNSWGLYDMSGNVWEWCSDWYGDYPTGSITDPAGPGTGSYRVLRGGSWDDLPQSLRSADRGYRGPGGRNKSYGFRAVLR